MTMSGRTGTQVENNTPVVGMRVRLVERIDDNDIAVRKGAVGEVMDWTADVEGYPDSGCVVVAFDSGVVKIKGRMRDIPWVMDRTRVLLPLTDWSKFKRCEQTGGD